MKNFISLVKKYAVNIADIVFIVGAVVSAVNTFIRAIDEHYPDRQNEIKNEK